jgi:L-histidine N-alpha-methyltransferase
MLADVRAGLARAQKELPPKFFYDQRGSELFEEITRLPEYYPTRTERALLEQWAPALIAELEPRTLMELGAGSAEKSRILLSAMRAAGEPATYVPVDVSASFLERTAATLRAEYPGMTVIPVVADITQRLGRLRDVPRPALVAFLGSTIGNFGEREAVALLRRVRAVMRAGDHFLLGVDLRKDVAVIEAAYNDAAGITAEFNRNVLRVLNRELGADFDPEAFAHRAFYEPTAHRVEMHLVSTRDQVVTIPGVGRVPFRAGESIRTEISCKYDRPTVERLFAEAGLALVRWIPDPKAWFALAVGGVGAAA